MKVEAEIKANYLLNVRLMVKYIMYSLEIETLLNFGEWT
jgi:hypothetical protein